MQNVALKIPQNQSNFSPSLGQLANTQFPTLNLNVKKALERRRHRKNLLTRSHTQAHTIIGTRIWYNGREWRNSILQFSKDNQLNKKIKIHAPEYLEAMCEIYLERDGDFFEHLILVVAMMRVGSDAAIEKWFWTEEEDFLEAYRLIKLHFTKLPPKQNCSEKSKLAILNFIESQFKNMEFTSRHILPYVSFGSAYIISIFKELVASKKIVWIGMSRYARVYKLNKNN